MTLPPPLPPLRCGETVAEVSSLARSHAWWRPVFHLHSSHHQRLTAQTESGPEPVPDAHGHQPHRHTGSNAPPSPRRPPTRPFSAAAGCRAGSGRKGSFMLHAVVLPPARRVGPAAIVILVAAYYGSRHSLSDQGDLGVSGESGALVVPAGAGLVAASPVEPVFCVSGRVGCQKSAWPVSCGDGPGSAVGHDVRPCPSVCSI